MQRQHRDPVGRVGEEFHQPGISFARSHFDLCERGVGVGGGVETKEAVGWRDDADTLFG